MVFFIGQDFWSMYSAMESRLRMVQSSQEDTEVGLVTRLARAFTRSDVYADRTDFVNLYVALKSKPLAILAGSAESEKNLLAQWLASALIGSGCVQTQMIAGHPWWARMCENISSHVRLQIRFATEKMLSVIEEASRPENVRQVFVACMIGISPAELLSFFTEVAFQLRHGQLMRIGDAHFLAPIPFPSNLSVIGTMDADSFDWWDDDLFSSATIIQRHQAGMLKNLLPNPVTLSEDIDFLGSRIRTSNEAYQKVCYVLRQLRHPLRPLLKIEALLRRYKVFLPATAVDDVMIYLANSWSKLGNGLFHPSPGRNLEIALDLAFAQILLPRAADAIRRSKMLQQQLGYNLKSHFPHSSAFMASLFASQS